MYCQNFKHQRMTNAITLFLNFILLKIFKMFLDRPHLTPTVPTARPTSAIAFSKY